MDEWPDAVDLSMRLHFQRDYEARSIDSTRQKTYEHRQRVMSADGMHASPIITPSSPHNRRGKRSCSGPPVSKGLEQSSRSNNMQEEQIRRTFPLSPVSVCL